MSLAEEILQNHKKGNKSFFKLFALSDKELITLLKDKILVDKHGGILNHNCSVLRTIKNEQPDKIEFCFYDRLEVQAFGIFFQPEHGGKQELISFVDNEPVIDYIEKL